ncbi:MAG: lipoyl domain-containing protein [Haloferacaceae archaeon]
MTADVDPSGVWPEDQRDVDGAVVTNWFVREGATVDEGETVCEIQVEKVSVDVPAPAAGTVGEILVDENEEFTRGDAVARIETD